MDKRTVSSAHQRIDDLNVTFASLRTEVPIQHKELFTRVKRLEAIMIVCDKNVSLTLTGNGDVIEPVDGVIGIGSGGLFATAAARALLDVPGMDAEAIGRKAMGIAADSEHSRACSPPPSSALLLVSLSRVFSSCCSCRPPRVVLRGLAG